MIKYKNLGWLNHGCQSPEQEAQWKACEHKKTVDSDPRGVTVYRCDTCQIEAKLDSGD